MDMENTVETRDSHVFSPFPALARKPVFCYNFLMPSRSLALTHRAARFLTLLAGTALVAVLAYGITNGGFQDLEGILIRPRIAPIPWKIFEEADVQRGVIAPADTNVVFHLPGTFDNIDGDVLFGHQSKTTRYWGYCLPQNYDPATVNKKRGLPGKIFLSQAEQAARAKQQSPKTTVQLSPWKLPTNEDLQALQIQRKIGLIHNEIDVFFPYTMCYLMAEHSIPLGLDSDGDNLNDPLEREIGTNPASPDTDSDGIWDGIEFFTGTSPFLRDTDGDGIIDGIEDKNWDGVRQADETDPRVKDSDRDGLCDGLCRVRFQNTDVFMGEDQNLNGTVDSGETDPLKVDTTGDGISDYAEFVACLMQGKTECP